MSLNFRLYRPIADSRTFDEAIKKDHFDSSNPGLKRHANCWSDENYMNWNSVSVYKFDTQNLLLITYIYIKNRCDPKREAHVGWLFLRHNQKNNISIGSIIYLRRTDEKISESRWLSHLSIPDVDRTEDPIRLGGGVILKELMDFHDRASIAIAGDLQGAILAFLRTKTGTRWTVIWR